MDVLRALSDPVRWSIVRQLGEVDELACSVLEHTLNIAKPTISYHTKILVQAGLMTVRKEGRNLFYTLNPETLQALTDQVWALAPGVDPVHDGRAQGRPVADSRRYKAIRPSRWAADSAVGAEHDPAVMTW